MADFDLAIIGGGISGSGIARDASGRGLRVLLVEMRDLGSGASSASSKMIHGGLRHLERRAFRMVREALRERQVLLDMAPHVVRPTRFLLPAAPGGRSPLMLRAGLLLYDRLGARRRLPASKAADLTHHPLAAPLKRSFRYGIEYSDCLVDDSRLVVLNVLDAAEHGAIVRTRTRLTRAERGEEWNLVLNTRGRREVASARALINATGPWIGEVAETVIRQPLPSPVRLIKGSHIVVRRRFEHDCGYMLQAPGGRVVVALPFAGEFTLIGTTSQNFVGDLNAPAPDAKEILYLCDAVNRYFRDKVTPDELAWSFAGVGAVREDGAKRPEDVNRDYVLALDERPHTALLLTIYGGRITTHRKLAEMAMVKIGHYFEGRPPWTAKSNLPGGAFAPDAFGDMVGQMMARWPFLTEAHARRLVRAYGTRAERFLGEAQKMEDLGERFTGDLTEAEVRYLVAHEWAETAEDVLFRRSKLGLTASEEERQALSRFVAGVAGETAENNAH